MVFATSIQGQEGRVQLAGIGALIGYFSHWSMSSPDKKTYVFTGTLGYFNEKLWKYGEERGYDRRITVKIGKEKVYRLCQPDDARIEIQDRQLTMEKVTLCLPEGR